MGAIASHCNSSIFFDKMSQHVIKLNTRNQFLCYVSQFIYRVRFISFLIPFQWASINLQVSGGVQDMARCVSLERKNARQ